MKPNLNSYIKTFKRAQDMAPYSHDRFSESKKAWLNDVRVMLSQRVTIPPLGVRGGEGELRQTFHFLTWVRPIASVTAVFLFVLTGGGMTVYGSLQSMPGDSLYALKLGVERLRVDLARNPQKKTEVLVAMANERLLEANRILATDTRPEVKTAVREFKEKVEQAKQLAEQNHEQGTLDQVEQLVSEKTLVIALQKTALPIPEQPAEDPLSEAEKAAEVAKVEVKVQLSSAPAIAPKPAAALSTREAANPFELRANLLYTPYEPKP